MSASNKGSSSAQLQSSLNKLSLSTQTRSDASKKPKRPVVDSWDDEDLSSGSETERPLTVQQSRDYPCAPPPTPLSPSRTRDRGNSTGLPFADVWGPGGGAAAASAAAAAPEDPRSSDRDETAAAPARRPEKTVSTASRMIAMGLGQKVPKRTEEQRAYDRAVRDKELKRRDAEREERRRAELDAVKAKAAIWEE
ncbi:MAG: hypothetical protein M1818_007512 [Claussenomyces sp. TS43310]|nr:MAG: hypothetical protein M1818_007512 [Claussenomyces sp. TS43310]